LITGAAGFLGSHLVPRLIDEGAEVCVLDQPNARRWELLERADLAGTVRADVRTLAEPAHDAVLGDIDVIFHLAAVGVMGEVSDVRQLVSGNIDGTLAVLLAARRLGSRLVYCGSCFEYGAGERWSEDALPAPTTEYGAAKAAGWLLANAFARRTGLEVVSLRPFTMYGPMEPPGRLVPSVVRHALAGRAIDLTPGDQLRDFVFVDDAVDAFVAAATTDAALGGTFNICSGTAGYRPGRGQPRPAVHGQPLRGPLWRALVSTDRARGPVRRSDAGAQVLGWRARVSLEDGLTRTITWFRSAGAEFPEYQLQ
jgi:nucleoside-diphosphate-sugar epimerase